MVREFELPDVGEGVAEGEIVSWLVAEGDAVTEDQPVAEVETDKAVVEVPSPVNGSVRTLHYEPGDVVPVGSVIVTFAEEGEETEATEAGEAAETGETVETGEDAERGTAAAETPEPGEGAGDGARGEKSRTFAAPSVRRFAREEGVSLQAIEGSGPGGRITEGDIRAAAAADTGEAEGGPPGQATPAEHGAGEATAGADGATAEVPATAGEPRERTLATPKARGVAKDLGVDIDRVPAVEERDGEAVVTEAAIQEYASAQRAAQAADAEAVASEGVSGTAPGESAGAAGVAGSVPEPEERIAYRGIRRTIGDRMEESKFTAPHVTHHDTVDATGLEAIREDLKERAEARDVKLTYMAFVMKAVVAALKEFPDLNSSLDEENEEVVRKGYYNIGVAVATEAGLMVPVVDHVDRKGLLEVAAEVNDLAAQARDRSIALEDLQGSTFSITNFGAIGGEYATPIINYPEVGILGLGAIEERPVAVDGEVLARPTLPLSLSIDHRVVDGAVAAEFTNTVMEYIKNPALLLLG